MRALKSYGIAIILVLGVAAWLATGVLIRGGNGPEKSEVSVVSTIEPDGGPITNAVESSGLAKHEAPIEPGNDPALSIAQRNALTAKNQGEQRIVRIQKFSVQPMALKAPLRGYTQANATLKAVARTSDLVETVNVTEGQKVKEGDVICTLQKGARESAVEQSRAAVAQAEAALTKAQADFDTNASMLAKGLSPQNSKQAFSAGLKGAQAGLEAAKVGLQNRLDDLDNTTITAGMSGVIQRPIAEVGSLMNFGGSCATIVQLDPMKFVGAIPQARINLAKIGLTGEVTTLNGQSASGKVTFIAVTADPATRTFAFEIEFPNPGNKILSGLTAEASVDMGNIPAHLLPQSVLTLDSDGVIGVQTVKDNKVVFYPVQILRDTRDGVWVTGLPPFIDVIVLGQEYVTDGQAVDARYAK